jgi:hypothetical protein
MREILNFRSRRLGRPSGFSGKNTDWWWVPANNWRTSVPLRNVRRIAIALQKTLAYLIGFLYESAYRRFWIACELTIIWFKKPWCHESSRGIRRLKTLNWSFFDFCRRRSLRKVARLIWIFAGNLKCQMPLKTARRKKPNLTHFAYRFDVFPLTWRQSHKSALSVSTLG